MFWNRFYDLCTQFNTSPNAVCSLLGLSTAVCTKWKKTGNIPSGDTLIKIADHFNCSIDYLVSRSNSPKINTAHIITDEPINIVKIPLAISKVSAGLGAYISDDYPDELDVDISTYPKADFAVKITGESMQPRFEDGMIVLVHKQPTLENGQIGIFMLNGEGFIKQYHIENNILTLVSLNTKYDPITLKPSDDFYIVGRVLYTL